MPNLSQLWPSIASNYIRHSKLKWRSVNTIGCYENSPWQENRQN